jgi:hypothetical protein
MRTPHVERVRCLVVNHALPKPGRLGRVRPDRKLEWISPSQEQVVGRVPKPDQRAVDVPPQACVSIANGIANNGYLAIAAKRRVEAQLAATPALSLTDRGVLRLVREGRPDPSFGCRVDRDLAEGIVNVNERAPASRSRNEHGTRVATKGQGDDPPPFVLVELRPVLN